MTLLIELESWATIHRGITGVATRDIWNPDEVLERRKGWVSIHHENLGPPPTHSPGPYQQCRIKVGYLEHNRVYCSARGDY